MGTRQVTLTGYQCHHAGDTDLRPNCEGFATVAYGRVALCEECDVMRSAVGREHAGRKFPGAAWSSSPVQRRPVKCAEQALADAVGSASRAGA